MNLELLKEIIKSLLQNEEEVYKIIVEHNVKGVSERAKETIEVIDSLIKHLDVYDNSLQIILDNLENKKNLKKSIK